MEVGDDAVVGDAEDGGFGVPVDGHDDAGATHPHQMLDRAGYAESDVEVRGNDVAARSDLVLTGQPAVVYDRPARSEFGVQRRGQVGRDGDLVRAADSAAGGNDPLRARQIDAARARRFTAENLAFLVPFAVGRPTDLEHPLRRLNRIVAAERADLHRGDDKSPRRSNLGPQPGLEDGPAETEAAASVERRRADRGDVGGAKPYRKSWRVLRRLVGVRQENHCRRRRIPAALPSDQDTKRLCVEPRRVGTETLFVQKGDPGVAAESPSAGANFLRPRSTARAFDQP